MKTAIIGAGISGLTIGRLLSSQHEVVIFEESSRPGGLCKCEYVKGNLFHTVGGHCFNSKRGDVLDWFWEQKAGLKDQFIKVQRNAVVSLNEGSIVPYPIENHIYKLPRELQARIIRDLLELGTLPDKTVDTFHDFLMSRFGKTLYDIYFAPYNRKIWQRSLKDVPLSWLKGKLPMPSVEEILISNFNHEEENNMVHSSFYASKVGGSQMIINTLAAGLDIRCNSKVDHMVYKEGKWEVMGEMFERVIFCANSYFLPDIISGICETALDRLKELEFHGTTSVLCLLNKNPYTWVYLPSEDFNAHRIICTGNFSQRNSECGAFSGIVEFSAKLSQAQIESQLDRVPLSPQYLAHHYEEFTYPVQSGNTRSIIDAVKSALRPKKFFLLGRFAEWEYYNMDAAMGAALDLFHSIRS